MAHYKRKNSRRVVRCTLCTPHRWLGNAKGGQTTAPFGSVIRRDLAANAAGSRIRLEQWRDGRTPEKSEGNLCWHFVACMKVARSSYSTRRPKDTRSLVAVVFLDAEPDQIADAKETLLLARSPAFKRLIERSIHEVEQGQTRPLQELFDELPD